MLSSKTFYQAIILAFDQNPLNPDASTNPSNPEISEVFSRWPLVVIALLALLLIGAYYLGRRHGGTNRPEPWSRVEVLTALGVAVMIATFIVTLLNVEVRKMAGTTVARGQSSI